MNKEATILTLHPQGKKGVNILLRRYELTTKALLDTLSQYSPLSPMDLYEKAAEQLASLLDGKPLWYAVTVKLDLEARGILKTVREKGRAKIHAVTPE